MENQSLILSVNITYHRRPLASFWQGSCGFTDDRCFTVDLSTTCSVFTVMETGERAAAANRLGSATYHSLLPRRRQASQLLPVFTLSRATAAADGELLATSGSNNFGNIIPTRM
nr:hypothetical protein Iba_chr14bCG15060 [Ipomoea batatas]